MYAQVSFAIRGHSSPFYRKVRDGSTFRLSNATVQDVLEDVAEYHEVNCGCLVNIGSRVWLASIPLDEAAMCDEPPPTTDALTLQTRLDSLPGPKPLNLSLLIDGEPLEFGKNEYLRLAREKRFISYSHEASIVFKRADSHPVPPSENVPSYLSLCTTPGTVFVDKSAYLRALLHSSRVNIIRRPRGFGKTTFLSMVDAYFDPESSPAHFPFIFKPELLNKSVFAAHGQMLVFSMDFANLLPHDELREDISMHDSETEEANGILGDDEEGADEDDDEGQYMSDDERMSDDEFVDEYVSDEAMDTKCSAFLNDAARAFYTRYQHIFHIHEATENRGGLAITFTDIIRWSEKADYTIVFLIDNYTAPLLSSDPRFSHAVTRSILKQLDYLEDGRTIRYGLLVGEDIPGAEDWIGMPATWRDLSHSPEFIEAIGFTHSEVVALGKALTVDLLPAIKSSLTLEQRNETRILYAAADVLAIARLMVKADLCSAAAVTMRALGLPMVKEVPGNITLGQRIASVLGSGPWPDPVQDDDVDMHTVFLDDDDDDDAIPVLSTADKSFESHPELTIDEGSSSRSSTSSSAGDSSSDLKKPLVILDGLEGPHPQKKI